MKFSEFALSPVPKRFTLFIETQPSFQLPKQVLTELLRLPSVGGFKGKKRDSSHGVDPPPEELYLRVLIASRRWRV